MQSRLQRWLLQHVGVFSVYREGMDREALKCAIGILVNAKRPLVLFPEGVISRSNDHLNHLMDGTTFIARNAAKQRAEQSLGKVVLHPVAIRYFFLGSLEPTIDPVLEEWSATAGLTKMNAAASERRSEAHGMRLAFNRITFNAPFHASPPGASKGATRDAATTALARRGSAQCRQSADPARLRPRRLTTGAAGWRGSSKEAPTPPSCCTSGFQRFAPARASGLDC
jgi:hypothetical protein